LKTSRSITLDLEVRVVITIRDDNIRVLHVEVLWLCVGVVVLCANPLLSRIDKVKVEAVVLVGSKVGRVCACSDSIAVSAVSARKSRVDGSLLGVVITGVDWVLGDTGTDEVTSVGLSALRNGD
jgi:hypothetical protein